MVEAGKAASGVERVLRVLPGLKTSHAAGAGRKSASKRLEI